MDVLCPHRESFRGGATQGWSRVRLDDLQSHVLTAYPSNPGGMPYQDPSFAASRVIVRIIYVRLVGFINVWF